MNQQQTRTSWAVSGDKLGANKPLLLVPRDTLADDCQQSLVFLGDRTRVNWLPVRPHAFFIDPTDVLWWCRVTASLDDAGERVELQTSRRVDRDADLSSAWRSEANYQRAIFVLAYTDIFTASYVASTDIPAASSLRRLLTSSWAGAFSVFSSTPGLPPNR